MWHTGSLLWLLDGAISSLRPTFRVSTSLVSLSMLFMLSCGPRGPGLSREMGTLITDTDTRTSSQNLGLLGLVVGGVGRSEVYGLRLRDRGRRGRLNGLPVVGRGVVRR